jgi:hypothetical protein
MHLLRSCLFALACLLAGGTDILETTAPVVVAGERSDEKDGKDEKGNFASKHGRAAAHFGRRNQPTHQDDFRSSRRLTLISTQDLVSTLRTGPKTFRGAGIFMRC